MERLFVREICTIIPQNISVADIDIDLYSVNYVHHNDFGQNMALMLGPNVMLTSSSTRSYLSTPFLDNHTFPVAFHPSVVLVRQHIRPDLLKQEICSQLRDLGQMVFAAEGNQNYLISGMDKGVPAQVLVRAIIQSGIQYVRVIHFGTKMPYSVFPEQGDIVRECDAVDSGALEENEYHISVNVTNSYMLSAKVEYPQRSGQQTLYHNVYSVRHKAIAPTELGWDIHNEVW